MKKIALISAILLSFLSFSAFAEEHADAAWNIPKWRLNMEKPGMARFW